MGRRKGFSRFLRLAPLRPVATAAPAPPVVADPAPPVVAPPLYWEKMLKKKDLKGMLVLRRVDTSDEVFARLTDYVNADISISVDDGVQVNSLFLLPLTENSVQISGRSWARTVKNLDLKSNKKLRLWLPGDENPNFRFEKV